MLSKEQIAQYHEQGYLKVEELFSPSESEESSSLSTMESSSDSTILLFDCCFFVFRLTSSCSFL